MRRRGYKYFGLLGLMGTGAVLVKEQPALAVLLVIAVIALVFMATKTKACATCGVTLKRASYRWEIDGRKKRVCPNCNRALERRQSQRAFSS